MRPPRCCGKETKLAGIHVAADEAYFDYKCRECGTIISKKKGEKDETD